MTAARPRPEPAAAAPAGRDRLVVIGASQGGVRALRTILGVLPPGFPLPVAIVLHRRAGVDGGLTQALQRGCVLPVAEPMDKEDIAPGRVWLAPADYHLLIEARHFALSTGPQVHFSRPSIDVLFESAAQAYGAGVLGVLLTGASVDGAAGLAHIKQAGGSTVVENPGSAQAAAMPAAALSIGVADRVLRLADLAEFLLGAVGIAPQATIANHRGPRT